VNPLLFLAPLWFAFEIWQLVVAERYLGIAHIERGTDPRKLPMNSGKAAFWSLGILVEYLWFLFLLTDQLGRAPAIFMIVVTGLGYLLRRGTSIRWILVILTFEGAIRIGMLLFICGAVWKQL